MRQLTCDPNVEVIGQVQLAFIDNLQRDEVLPILEKHQLTDIDPNQWYSAQGWLNVLNELDSVDYVAIGLQTAQHVVLPPGAENLTYLEIMTKWDEIYQLQHRGGDIGGLKVEEVTPTHYRAEWNIIYPDDMAYGVAFGFARRFLPTGTAFTLKYDPDFTRVDDGGEKTVLHIHLDEAN